VTCTDSGGPLDFVVDGKTGRVTDPTPASLAPALAELAADSALAERLGEAGRAAVATLSWAAVARRLVIV
jgi:glycosyltransferase involved in cell wall biosynthesis